MLEKWVNEDLKRRSVHTSIAKSPIDFGHGSESSLHLVNNACRRCARRNQPNTAPHPSIAKDASLGAAAANCRPSTDAGKDSSNVHRKSLAYDGPFGKPVHNTNCGTPRPAQNRNRGSSAPRIDRNQRFLFAGRSIVSSLRETAFLT